MYKSAYRVKYDVICYFSNNNVSAVLFVTKDNIFFYKPK